MALEIEEKRRTSRLCLRTPVRYQVRGSPELTDTITDNLSASGLGLFSANFVAPQSLVMLEINVLARQLRPIGRIAWTASMGHSDNYRSGIEFIEMSPQDKEYLQDFIHMQEGKL